ncbi:MAG: endonuclease domain-containing protein [Armatimonadota bacterium]|nr:endonuclease domain-containing protein [Armatimonadota bacterium]
MDSKQHGEEIAATLQALARQARREQTPAEEALWKLLRAHRCGNLHFRRQAQVGPFRIDFYCASLRLAVEVDGSVHHEPEVQRRDLDRQTILAQDFGIYVLRVTNEDVLQRPHPTRQRILQTARTLANASLSRAAGEVASLSETEGVS